MEVFESIRTRHSYRGEFLPARVPREDLAAILRAGADSPTGCNMQTPQFVAVDDPDTLAALSACTSLAYAASAPAAILVFTKETPSYKGHSYHVQDYAAAVQTMMLALTALGYASCWVEGQIQEGDIARRMAAVVQAPEDMQLAVYMPLGRPATPPVRVKKQAFDARCYCNTYGNPM